MSTQNGLVQRLWSYCNVLRDDGLSYGDYLEQLTYLLFLKMADEQTKAPFSRPAIVPEGLDWPSLLERDGDELEVHYRHVLTVFDRKPASEAPWTRELWVYDLRTNQHFTLKQNPLRLEHLQEFTSSYAAGDRSKRVESERFNRFSYDELIVRDKASLDITWLRDDSLEDRRTCRRPK